MKTHHLLTLLLIFWAIPSSAEVYRWVNEQGQVHYSDKPTNGYAEKVIINDHRQQAPDNEPEKDEAELRKVTETQRLIDGSESTITSWSVKEESEDHLLLKIDYFYDGLFDDVQMWISASSIEPGKFIAYAVRPAKISEGKNSALVKLGVSSKAESDFCTSFIEFSIYGKISGDKTKTFITSTVDHKKCWKNNHFEPKQSKPVKVI